jgi:hypothetical protein
MNSSYKNEMSGYKPPKENYRLLSTQLNSHDKKNIEKGEELRWLVLRCNDARLRNKVYDEDETCYQMEAENIC